MLASGQITDSSVLRVLTSLEVFSKKTSLVYHFVSDVVLPKHWHAECLNHDLYVDCKLIPSEYKYNIFLSYAPECILVI